jgi:DNA mismatch repair protein MutS
MDTIVFYRLGDFYEMFFEDAQIASKELDLVLTAKAAGNKQKIPMCGIPYHAKDNYLPKLVNRGYKVAIVEQMESPNETKTIVKRDVVKVVTPGTLASTDEKDSICIGSIIDNQYCYTMSVVDVSTGETVGYNIDHNFASVKAILLKNNIKEVVLLSDFNERLIKYFREMAITISYCDVYQLEENYYHLYSHINDKRIIVAYGLLVNYLTNTQFQMIGHLRVVKVEDENKYMKMDYSTITNLELIQPLRSMSKNDTLWSFLDHCKTSMGARLLKKLVEKPLIDKNEINERLDKVSIIKDDLILLDELKESLSNIYDISRLVAKIAMNSSNPTDLIRLKKSLIELPKLKNMFSDYSQFDELFNIDECKDLKQIVNSAIVDQPPANFKDTGVIKSGYNKILDDLVELSNNNQTWILNQEIIEKERTGIKTLRIGYNKVFGYYIEVSKGQISQLKPEYGYIRKQTLSNAERYITEELKSKEDEILHSKEQALAKEHELYLELVDIIKDYLFKLQRIADVIAYVDCLYSLAVQSKGFGYIRPEFEDDKLEVINGKHPILARSMKEKYVSNDCMLNKDEIMIITGPNMGGKSTYMRQLALISIMAQIGCYVPADSAKLTIFDQIFTRIGASDDILSGQSTFMVEMNEANNALSNATEKSLIIFDEIGRGTSTYDGMALASAMIEYIHYNIKAKTLFSTHYHELTRLEDRVENILNYHALIHEENDEVKFLYKVTKGKADKSYGINVAKLAKLPDSVISRAKMILEEYENDDKVVQQTFDFNEVVVEDNKNQKIIDKLNLVDPDNMTPMGALEFIMDLKKGIK